MERIKLPPTYCSAICSNAMSEICIEKCAIARDCSGFKLRKGTDILSIPRFPIDQIGEMTREEKFIIVAVYLAKTVDFIQGVPNVEPTHHPRRRPHSNHSTGSKVFADRQIQSVLHGLSEAITDHPFGQKHQDQDLRSSEVVGADD